MSPCGIESPNTWQIGSWTPSLCYRVVGADPPGTLFFRTWRDGGVLVYEPMEVPTRKEKEKEKEKDPGPSDTLPEQLLKLGGELLPISSGLRDCLTLASR